MTSEQRPECNQGANYAKIWRKAFQTEGSTNTNTLRWEKKTLYIREITGRASDCSGIKEAESGMN